MLPLLATCSRRVSQVFVRAVNVMASIQHADATRQHSPSFDSQQGHTVFVPGEDTALPRVQQLVPHSAAGSGMCVAEPFLLLRPESAGAVAGGAGGAVGTLPELAAAVMAGGGYVAGIDLMFGYVALTSVNDERRAGAACPGLIRPGPKFHACSHHMCPCHIHHL